LHLAAALQRQREQLGGSWIRPPIRHAACLKLVVINAKPHPTRLFRIPGALWNAVASWNADGGPRLGASVAFYSIFALAPLLIVGLRLPVPSLAPTRCETSSAQMTGLIGPEAPKP
jgi:hypothetical protein